ncbi:hypothetical protein BDA99DRAFT_493060 [Phascolomyces articulosus]|uniref:Transcription initiation factor IIE subunit beta n=1 Tax=Phascolomyces articulosus TaxID=60185 RepID=A0AAD5KD45_9FUNG|nr:hypothetical protein BDA99DRAFT_493060 [Phascolomyces articulosus]
MSQLTDQVKNFKKSLTANTMLGVKRVVSQTKSVDSQSSTPKYGSINNNTRAAFETDSPRKKSKKSTVYSQPANTGIGHHAMSQLYTVIQFLKESDTAQSVVSIISRTKVDIRKNQALWEKLVNNDKIDYDVVNDTFVYKPTYQIRSKEDLLELLIQKREDGGMDYKDLKDSYSKLGDAVEELANEGQILVIRHKDGNPRILFYNEMQYNTPVDDEFRKMWAGIKIPDETDLPKALENAGLKTMEVFEKKVVSEPKLKRSKTRNRKFKITNTHLANIDLSRDYVPNKQ